MASTTPIYEYRQPADVDIRSGDIRWVGTGDVQWCVGDALFEQRLYLRAITGLGELIGSAGYGADLGDMIEDPFDISTVAVTLEQRLSEQFSQDPDVARVLEVDVSLSGNFFLMITVIVEKVVGPTQTISFSVPIV